MFRSSLAAVGVAVLLLTAGCVGSLAPSADASAQRTGSDGKTIAVSATGQAEASPDQAVLTVAVVATGDTANAVREQLANNTTRLLTALRSANLSEDQIRTVSFTIEQQFEETEEGRQPTGLRGVHTFEITVPNVSRAGEIIDVAVSSGANRVENVRLTLSEERRREVRAEALRDAVQNARANAEVIAETANLTVVGVHRASTADVSFSPFRAEATRAVSAGDAETSIESGPVTVTADVQVVYNATG